MRSAWIERRRPRVAVVLDEWLGLLVVDVVPMLDLVGGVVAASLDPGAAEQALDRDLVGDLEVEDGAKLAAVELGEDAVERLGLGERAREAVEDEAPGGVILGQPAAHDLDRDVVGDEVAVVEDRLHALAQLGAGGALGAEHVAGVDVRDAFRRGDELALGALTGPWGAEDDDVERH